MENKFIKFWKKFGPYFLIGTGITQFIMFEEWAVGSLFMGLGFMLIAEND